MRFIYDKEFETVISLDKLNGVWWGSESDRYYANFGYEIDMEISKKTFDKIVKMAKYYESELNRVEEL